MCFVSRFAIGRCASRHHVYLTGRNHSADTFGVFSNHMNVGHAMRPVSQCGVPGKEYEVYFKYLVSSNNRLPYLECSLALPCTGRRYSVYISIDC